MKSHRSFGIALSCAALTVTMASAAGAQLGRQKGLLDPNWAPDTALLKLPHMNATIVKSIKDAFPIISIVTLDSILAKNSLTKPQRDSLYTRMFIHVDLNRGTDAEILLIPGAGQTMVREFKEYRPWTSFAQFEREIGKYVRNRPGEVERLEQYVFIPIDLNTATDELVMTFAPIGVGTTKWVDEFKEYRPWTSMAQFRREIGKYVRSNPKELTRLEKYVIIK